MFPDLKINKFILQGVRIMSKEINKKVERDCLLVLRKFEIVNICDFQEDAIPFALAECLSELFDIEMPNYSVEFNSKDKKLSIMPAVGITEIKNCLHSLRHSSKLLALENYIMPQQ